MSSRRPSGRGGAGPGARECRLLDLRAAYRFPGSARAMRQQGAALVDVRERTRGSPRQYGPGRATSRPGFLELRIEDNPDLDQPVLVMCGSRTRCSRTRTSCAWAIGMCTSSSRSVRLEERGAALRVTAGPGRPKPRALLPAPAHARGRRGREAGHLRRLMSSKVMLAGAGGLGPPAALYLAAPAIGAPLGSWAGRCGRPQQSPAPGFPHRCTVRDSQGLGIRARLCSRSIPQSTSTGMRCASTSHRRGPPAGL